jgi:hypothetical protein
VSEQQQNALVYSIHLITAEMGEPGSQVYNHIRFRNHLGQDALAFHGIAVARDIDGSRALRVVMTPVQGDGLPSRSFRIVHSECLFRGSAEDYLRKLACAGDAAHFINQQNLTYNPEDENGESPNSIAHTLVKAMELEVPEVTEQFWAPGHARIILPYNWRSTYAA